MYVPLELLGHHEAVVFEGGDGDGDAVLHIREVVGRDSEGPECQTTRTDYQDLAHAILTSFSQQILWNTNNQFS